MLNSAKLLLLSGAAVGVMLLAVAAASANRLAFDDSDINIAFEALTFRPASGGEVRCSVTLVGSFHSTTITKTSGSLIGNVTHARVEACSGGRATILTGTLPWHIRYESFGGELPDITEVRTSIVGLSMQIANGTATCLLATTTSEPVYVLLDKWRTPPFDLVRPEGTIDLTGGFICELAGDIDVSGTETEIEDNEGSLLNLSLV